MKKLFLGLLLAAGSVGFISATEAPTKQEARKEAEGTLNKVDLNQVVKAAGGGSKAKGIKNLLGAFRNKTAADKQARSDLIKLLTSKKEQLKEIHDWLVLACDEDFNELLQKFVQAFDKLLGQNGKIANNDLFKVNGPVCTPIKQLDELSEAYNALKPFLSKE